MTAHQLPECTQQLRCPCSRPPLLAPGKRWGADRSQPRQRVLRPCRRKRHPLRSPASSAVGSRKQSFDDRILRAHLGNSLQLARTTDACLEGQHLLPRTCERITPSTEEPLPGRSPDNSPRRTRALVAARTTSRQGRRDRSPLSSAAVKPRTPRGEVCMDAYIRAHFHVPGGIQTSPSSLSAITWRVRHGVKKRHLRCKPLGGSSCLRPRLCQTLPYIQARKAL